MNKATSKAEATRKGKQKIVARPLLIEFEEDDNRQPSEVTDTYWLFAWRTIGTYPRATENNGKWLVFVPTHQVDKVWESIKRATREGKFGNSAKVSTKRPKPSDKDSQKVICVYTYDWTDEADVRRIRQELRELGVTWKIAYKSDSDTLAGKYRSSGHQRISKYYE